MRILLIGTNPRWEAPVLNARIRKRYLRAVCAIGGFGPAVDLTYPLRASRRRPGDPARLVAGEHGFARALARPSSRC